MKTRLQQMTSAACIAAAITAGIVLAACSDDARIPGADDDTTAQPIRFTAVRPAPIATRAISGNDKWKGDGTERIGVKFYKPGTGSIEGTCPRRIRPLLRGPRHPAGHEQEAFHIRHDTECGWQL
ncbi:hypothetical protein [Parabacteroides pacaensis]|uniref:hypothetical protein n=1 Tax=Parabacteroides pacaensis TaxID=2086575 RepID=UPI00131AC299|nr:hypothetical protein [Parabacteroides pacaensis]